MEIIVYGRPAPKGSKQAVGRTKTGRAILVESSERAKPWQTKVTDAARDAIDNTPGWEPLSGPVLIHTVFTVRKPTTAPKRRRTWPTTRYSGDGDKLTRCVWDGLVDAGMLGDDSQVVSWLGSKVYPGEGAGSLDTPGVRIWVGPAGDDQ